MPDTHQGTFWFLLLHRLSCAKMASMPRTARASVGGICYHVLNRGNARADVFHKDGDFTALLKLIADANERLPMRVLAYCLLNNHFHLVVRPRNDGDLSRWMQFGTRAEPAPRQLGQTGGTVAGVEPGVVHFGQAPRDPQRLADCVSGRMAEARESSPIGSGGKGPATRDRARPAIWRGDLGKGRRKASGLGINAPPPWSPSQNRKVECPLLSPCAERPHQFA